MGSKDTDILLEDINDKLKSILEGQAAMASVPADIGEIKDRLTTVESDVAVIKAAVKDQSHDQHSQRDQLADHEVRITGLEQAA